MRKLLFFSIAMSLLLNTKAQVETRKLESVPMQKPSIEKEKDALFAPINEAGVLSNSNYYYSKPARKANYIPLSTVVKSAGFAERNMVIESSEGFVDEFNNVYLFPDSLAKMYVHYVNGDTIKEYWALQQKSTGFTFDPYSLNFDDFGSNGMPIDGSKFFFEKGSTENTYYGYRLDEFSISKDYRMANYNPASKDTLRFYISHYSAYKKEADSNDFRKSYWTEVVNGDTVIWAHAVVPRFTYFDPLPEKGIGTAMRSSNLITVDYLLSDVDSLANRLPGHSYQGGPKGYIDIEIPGGFEVPAGHCLSVMVRFLPGFNYAVPDTTINCDSVVFENGTIQYADSSWNMAVDGSIFFGNDSILIFGEDTLFFFGGGSELIVFKNDTLYFDGTDFDKDITIFFGCEEFISLAVVDTISKVYINSSLPETDPVALRVPYEDIPMNRFSMYGWNMGNTAELRRCMFDSKGYNRSFHETNGIRHKNPEDGETNYVSNLYYHPSYYFFPAFWMSLSYTEDNKLTVPVEVSIPDHGQNLISQIYPNPATTRLTVDLNEADKANVTIYNILGQAVIEETLHGISNSINIAELSSGLYFVKVTQNGRSHTVKISKE